MGLCPGHMRCAVFADTSPTRRPRSCSAITCSPEGFQPRANNPARCTRYPIQCRSATSDAFTHSPRLPPPAQWPAIVDALAATTPGSDGMRSSNGRTKRGRARIGISDGRSAQVERHCVVTGASVHVDGLKRFIQQQPARHQHGAECDSGAIKTPYASAACGRYCRRPAAVRHLADRHVCSATPGTTIPARQLTKAAKASAVKSMWTPEARISSGASRMMAVSAHSAAKAEHHPERQISSSASAAPTAPCRSTWRLAPRVPRSAGGSREEQVRQVHHYDQQHCCRQQQQTCARTAGDLLLQTWTTKPASLPSRPSIGIWCSGSCRDPPSARATRRQAADASIIEVAHDVSGRHRRAMASRCLPRHSPALSMEAGHRTSAAGSTPTTHRESRPTRSC